MSGMTHHLTETPLQKGKKTVLNIDRQSGRPFSLADLVKMSGGAAVLKAKIVSYAHLQS